MSNTQVNTVNTQKSTLYIQFSFFFLFTPFFLPPVLYLSKKYRAEVYCIKSVKFWVFTTVTLLYSTLCSVFCTNNNCGEVV